MLKNRYFSIMNLILAVIMLGVFTVTFVSCPNNTTTSSVGIKTYDDRERGGDDNGTPSYSVNMLDNGYGKAAAAPSSAKEGAAVAISASSNVLTYDFYSWDVVEGGITLTAKGKNAAEFTMPANDVTIRANFFPEGYDPTKSDGAAVDKPVLNTKTKNTITINGVTPPVNGQGVEYNIGMTGNGKDFMVSPWQTTTTTFSGLTPNTIYYVYARSAANLTHNAGTPNASDPITTDAPDPGDPNLVLSRGSVNFGSAAYSIQPAAEPITVTNTGGAAATGISISLDGGDFSSFTLSDTFIDIAAGGNKTFSVRPNAGLDAGKTYSTTVKVTYNEGAPLPVSVTFTVTKADGSAVSAAPLLDKTHDKITVTNAITLTESTGQSIEYAISDLSGTEAPNTLTWTVNKKVFTGLQSNKTYYVYVRSAEDSNYNAGAVKVTGITTDAPASETPNLVLSMDSVDFGTETYGVQPEAELIKITNTGGAAATGVSISLGGDDSSSFTLSDHTFTSLAPGSVTFSVRPNAGLDTGTYNAVIKITYNEGVPLSVSVTFTVNAVTMPGISITQITDTTVTAAVTNAPASFTAKILPAGGGPAVKTYTVTGDDEIYFDNLDPNTSYKISITGDVGGSTTTIDSDPFKTFKQASSSLTKLAINCHLNKGIPPDITLYIHIETNSFITPEYYLFYCFDPISGKTYIYQLESDFFDDDHEFAINGNGVEMDVSLCEVWIKAINEAQEVEESNHWSFW